MVGMTVPQPESSTDALVQLLRLQADFVARLSEETVRYLRGLQGIAGPAAPGTIVLPGTGEVVELEGRPGEAVSISVEVTNEQQVHSAVAPALTSLVSETGATWFPDAVATPAYALVAPLATRALTLEVSVPAELPPGDYRGAILIRPGGAGAGVLARVLAPREGAESPAEPRGTTGSAGPAAVTGARRKGPGGSGQPAVDETDGSSAPRDEKGRGRHG